MASECWLDSFPRLETAARGEQSTDAALPWWHQPVDKAAAGFLDRMYYVVHSTESVGEGEGRRWPRTSWMAWGGSPTRPC